MDFGQHLTITFSYNQQLFMISAVYARCKALEWLELWEEQSNLDDNILCPWLIGGDFNVILHEEEKQGDSPSPPWRPRILQVVLVHIPCQR